MWESSPQPSRFAVVSNYFDVRTAGYEGETTVIDGMLLDPLTPNVEFNVYYTSEGNASAATSTEEWEKKLWTRVPKIFVASQRQEYVLPEPIVASFVKIEYTNLQPKSYVPGNFQLPVTYKKFPDWVLQYFLEQTESPEFVVGSVGVVNNSVHLLYKYYLEDLEQKPEMPVATPEKGTVETRSFFKTTENEAHPSTLEKIDLSNERYKQPPALSSDPSTLLGQKSRYENSLVTNYPTEGSGEQVTSNLLYVSSPNRENLAEEEVVPPLFFYLTCRHEYKELTAKFEYNRAYFAAINEISFIRHSYASVYDGEIYIESGGDMENAELNDFVINDNKLWKT